jgi:hypothetical protein
MAFATVCVILLSKYKPLSEVLETQQVSDLGNFLFAFTLFWAYVNVSQLIIIWAGNMGEDNIWYLVRLQTGWRSCTRQPLLTVFAF